MEGREGGDPSVKFFMKVMQEHNKKMMTDIATRFDRIELCLDQVENSSQARISRNPTYVEEYIDDEFE